MSPRLRARAGRPARIVFQPGLVAPPPARGLRTRHGPQSSLTGFDRSPKPGQRPPDPSPFDGSPRPDEPPDAGPLDHRQALRRRYEPSSPRRSVSGRSLRQGRQGDTVEAIAPGCGNAPIEACRKADGLRFVFDVT